MQTAIYIENQRLDLFKDETIQVTSSVLDVQDISKNTTEYSNSFTVPASANNNQIFKHYYEADIDTSFDARVTADARIELDGIVFRVGKIALQKVDVRSGKPYAYTINFYGNLVSLKDTLGTDKLSFLDFSSLEIAYNSSIVRTLLEGSIINPDLYPNIIFTFLSKRRYYYSTNPSDLTNTDTETNIAYNSASGSNGVLWSELKPSVKLIKIIEAIENDYGITFSRDFLSSESFTSLYLWLDNGSSDGIGGDTDIVDFTSKDTEHYMNLTTNVWGYTIPDTTSYYEMKLVLNVTPKSGYEAVNYKIRTYSNGELISLKESSGTSSTTYKITNTRYQDPILDYEVFYEIESDAVFDFDATMTQRETIGATIGDTYTAYAANNSLSSNLNVSDNMPDMQIIDFLKGIFNAFKMVLIPDQDGTIYLDTVNGYYSKGDIINLTKYVDIDRIEVSRAELLNVIDYKFQEPTTILNEQFEVINGEGYGDEYFELKDENGQLLDGSELTVQLPFEQIVYEKLTDTYTNDETNVIYGGVFDKSIAPADPKPHIFYNVKRTIGGSGIGFIDDTGTKSKIDGAVFTVSHAISDDSPTDSFIFGAETNEFTGAVLTNNLYTNYHQRYVNALFNKKRRNYTVKCNNIPPHIINSIGLNDIIQIKTSYYRIDKFMVNLLKGEVTFNLFNITSLADFVFSSNDTYITLSNAAQSYTSYVTNLGSYTAVKTDTGFGTSWLTVSDDGSNLIFTVTDNVSVERSMTVTITDNESGVSIVYTIVQQSGIITADTTLIKADTNLITADNV